MRYLFLGVLYEKDNYDIFLNFRKGVMKHSSGSIFGWNLIDGLDICTDNNVDILNVLPVGVYPHQYKKLFLKTREWSHNDKSKNIEIGSVNLPFLKQFMRTFKIKRYIRKWIKNSADNTAIIVHGTYQPFLSAIQKLPDNIKVSLIIPDLPEFCELSQKKSAVRDYLRSINNKIIYKGLNRIDTFVLLTSQMKEFLRGGKGKPYIVVEGVASAPSYGLSFEPDNNCKTILYTGSLMYQFGIKNLLQAFKEINDSSYQLWICGSGEAEEEIKELCESDKRIIFYGHVNKAKIYELQNKATVLINSRTNEGEYTKYSFPSKTMEYMASGKPVIMYKLDGIPDEYDEYLHYVEDNSIDALKNKIIEVCSKPNEELYDFGMRAREWVLREKNSVAQAKKIIKMINKKED